MKRTVRTRGGRYAAALALGRAAGSTVRGSARVERDAEFARLKRLNSLVRWVSSSPASNRKPAPSARSAPAPAADGSAIERQLTNAIESITEGFALWDADDRLILCNAKFRAFYPAVASLLHPGASYEQVLRDALSKGAYCVDSPAEDWLQRRLHAHRVRGGTCEERLSDGRWLLATEHPTSDGGRVCIRTDITQRKQAEQAVRRSRATLQSMIDAVDDMIAMVNANGVILAINRAGAQGFGRQPRDLVGRSLPEQFDPGPGVPLQDMVAGVLAEAKGMHADVVWRDRCLHLSAHPVMDGSGAPTAVSIFSRDITERVRGEEEARDHQNQLTRYMRIATMGEMTAALAHELNQPIAAIVNYCNGSLRRLAADRWTVEDLEDAINETYAEAKRARDIIQNVSRFVRKAPQHRATSDIASVVGSVANLIRKDLQRHGIELVIDLPSVAVPVNVNAVEIEQTLLNLLRNSMEAITEALPPTRKIVLRATVQERELEIGVHDTGTGLSPDTAAQIFDPFFTTKREGMGMGLAICRTIVEDHGGRIWAESRDSQSPPQFAGGGALHFTLPISETNNAAA